MKTIVVACDDQTLLRSLDDILTRVGYKTITAGNGEAAFALIRDGAPVDLVVIDLVTPGMDGLEFLSRIRRVNPWLPCVMIAGHCSIEVYLKASNLGVYDYLNKPVSSKKIAKVIASALKSGPPGRIAFGGSGDDVCTTDTQDQSWKKVS
jgi:DNA-binding NtrC family response regulator